MGCGGSSTAPASQSVGAREGAAEPRSRAVFVRDFSNVQSFVRRFDHPERDSWQKPQEVVALLEVRPGMVVADIGAGTGYFLSHLAQAVGETGRVVGLDTEPAMVDYMRARAEGEGLQNVTAERVAPDHPGLRPASVDRILLVNTWHHIEGRGPYAALLRQALKPGGLVVIVDFTLDSPAGPPVEKRVGPEEAIAELRQGGLTAVLAEETLPYQYVVKARR